MGGMIFLSGDKNSNLDVFHLYATDDLWTSFQEEKLIKWKYGLKKIYGLNNVSVQ